MANFLLLYHGGMGMPQNDADKQKVLAAWNDWMGKVDGDLVDAGNPTSNVQTLKQSGAEAFAGNRVSGYSIIQAEDLEHALEIAKTAPIVAQGGSIDVYETFNAM
ncbi:MAG TPA: hypothetical protein VIM53_00385 [Candidatus Saccharimonadales bacterium]